MDPRLAPLAGTARLNTRLFLNCLDGVEDATGLRRLSDRTNHMTFLGAHLVGARAYLAGLLGQDTGYSFEAMLSAVNSIEEAEELPGLDEIRREWRSVSARVLEGLESTSAAALDEVQEHGFPIDDPTLAGKVAFLLQHDSYHIGQLAFLRKHWGLGAMSYERETTS